MISFLRGLAVATVLQGCAIRSASPAEVQYPEQQEVSSGATLDELLSRTGYRRK